MLGPGEGLPFTDELSSRSIPLGDHPLGPVQAIANLLRIGSTQCDSTLEFLGLLNDQPVPILEQRDPRCLESQLSLDAGGPGLTNLDFLLPGEFLQLGGIEPTEFVSLLHERAILDHADNHRAIGVRDVLDLAGDHGFLGRLEIPAGNDHRIQVGTSDLDLF